MNVLQRMTRAFVMASGITEPTPQQEKRAAVLIFGLLSLLIAALVGIFFLMLHLI